MNRLEQIDGLNQEIAKALFESVPMPSWTEVVAVTKSTPDGSALSRTVRFGLLDGTVDRGSSPVRKYERRFSELTEQHWRLTQDLGFPRWFAMTVTVQRSGKCSFEFEYKDDYKEGDIMQRG